MKHFFNKYFIMIYMAAIFAMLLTMLILTGLISDIQNNIGMLDYEYTMSRAHLATQLMAPFYAGTAALLFAQRKENIFPFLAGRKKHLTRLLRKEMLRVCLKVSTAVFAAFLTLDLPFYLLIKRYDGQYPLGFMADLLGQNFLQKHVGLYFLLLGLNCEFFAILLYSILACCFALVFARKYKAFLSICFYFFGWTIFVLKIPDFSIGTFSFGRVAFYLAPATITAPDAVLLSTPLMWLAAVLEVTLIAFFCVRHYVKAKEWI